ncbi:hypothetical protein BH20ACT19_BH20ACT19_13360 [soil metagenome]
MACKNRRGDPVSLLDVDIQSSAGRVDASLCGEVDLSTVAALERRLEEGLADTPETLVLDLRKVTFLDSSGLRLMLRLDKRQSEAGGRLVVVRGGRRVARVLELTGADERLELVGDPSEVAGADDADGA